VQSNLVAHGVGLNSGVIGSIMDPEMAIFQNGYGYSFVQDDLDALSTKHLPGKDRDPNEEEQTTP